MPAYKGKNNKIFLVLHELLEILWSSLTTAQFLFIFCSFLFGYLCFHKFGKVLLLKLQLYRYQIRLILHAVTRQVSSMIHSAGTTVSPVMDIVFI